MTSWAVDIGGTKIAAASVRDDGALDGEPVVLSTPGPDGPDAVIAQVVNALGRLNGRGVEQVGISSAGVIDSAHGTVLGATASIRGWAGTDLAGRVTRAVGLPTTAIGDGHAFAIGEAVYGEAAGHASAVVLAVGTGVGGSYVQHRHSPAGQPLGSGSLRARTGRPGHRNALLLRPRRSPRSHRQRRRACTGGTSRNSGDPTVESARQVVERADHDPIAAAAVTLAAGAVGEAAAGLANAFDPDVVVIAGGVSKSGPRWQDPMRAAFINHLDPRPRGHAARRLRRRSLARASRSGLLRPTTRELGMRPPVLEEIRSRLVVSCQAYPGEPMRDPDIMTAVARAVADGGAAAIRAQGLEDLHSIRAAVSLPLIGLVKRGNGRRVHHAHMRRLHRSRPHRS